MNAKERFEKWADALEVCPACGMEAGLCMDYGQDGDVSYIACTCCEAKWDSEHGRVDE